jgi:hypothetical protein
MSEVVGRTSAVCSTKRTVEVIPVRLVGAEEEESGCGSSEMISEDMRGVPLQPPPLLRLLRLEAGGY